MCPFRDRLALAKDRVRQLVGWVHGFSTLIILVNGKRDTCPTKALINNRNKTMNLSYTETGLAKAI